MEEIASISFYPLFSFIMFANTLYIVTFYIMISIYLENEKEMCKDTKVTDCKWIMMCILRIYPTGQEF